MIYNNNEFIHKISINIKDLNSVNNIEDILYLKLNTLENKCFEYGYVKENSIKILKKTQGYLNPIIFVPFIEYKLLCSADIFKPNVNDIYLVEILSINKIAIMCCIKYTYNNKTIMPIRIIIAKHTQDTELINNVKKGDKIYVKIIGYKFTKNSNNIDSIANIISESEINDIKMLKIIFNKLDTIKHNEYIDIKIINKYNNIVKFILDKNEITYNELFIYHFISENNITIHTQDFLEQYNNYLLNFTKKNIVKQINHKISNTEDLSNIELDNETIPEEETNHDCESNIDDFYTVNSDINVDYESEENESDEDESDEDEMLEKNMEEENKFENKDI